MVTRKQESNPILSPNDKNVKQDIIFVQASSSTPYHTTMTDPLPDAVKALNQRFLAEGCFTQARATELWETELSATFETGGRSMTLKQAIKASNKQLTVAGLEIVGVVLEGTTYYSLINKHGDEVAKQGFAATWGGGTAEVNYVRLVLSKLAEGPCSRAQLNNSRNEIKEKNFDVDTAQLILDRLLDEFWIMPETGQEKQRRSSNQIKLALGPRSFMELSYLLEDQFGMDKADIPQIIILG